MSDTIKPWYNIIGKENKDVKLDVDKDFKDHHILPSSLISVIGGSGSGKSTSIIEFMTRKQSFHRIIFFSASGFNEPIYKYIKKHLPEVEYYDDIKELPALKDIEDVDNEKLIVFDDFITLPSKDFKKINEYFVAGRKKKFTVIALAQSYISLPKIITRNSNYFFIFRLNDNVSINTIIKNHNVLGLSKEDFKQVYEMSTKKKGDFMMIDLKTNDRRYMLRHNFLNLFRF